MPSSLETPPSYRHLFAVRGLPRLAAATVLARTGTQMQAVVLVLFVLRRFQSPPLAGLVVFLMIVPGLVLSPVAGALLDRHRRMRLITFDYAVAAATLALIAVLARGRLPAGVLLVIVSIGSLTNPLSNSGTRSLFPAIVPRHLWERANAMDSGGYVVATVVGPALGGVLVGVFGGSVGLVGTALFFLAALLMLVSMAEPLVERVVMGSLFGDAWRGLRYVLNSPSLRGLALTCVIFNIGYGIVTVSMPVLLLTHLHAGDAAVGAMWAVMGATGLIAGTLSGRMQSEGREVWFLVFGCAASILALLGLLVAGSVGGGVVLVALAMGIAGIANGPYDVGLFSLRQRVTEPAWMGRAFAVSMALNFVGLPIGSALAGPVVEHSLSAALAIGLAAVIAAGGIALMILRPAAASASPRPEPRNSAVASGA